MKAFTYEKYRPPQTLGWRRPASLRRTPMKSW